MISINIENHVVYKQNWSSINKKIVQYNLRGAE